MTQEKKARNTRPLCTAALHSFVSSYRHSVFTMMEDDHPSVHVPLPRRSSSLPSLGTFDQSFERGVSRVGGSVRFFLNFKIAGFPFPVGQSP